MADPAAPADDIHALWARVKAHPDFAFGTIFVPEDFPDGQIPEDFNSNFASDVLVERGNAYIHEEL